MNSPQITYCQFEPDACLKDYIQAYWYLNIQTSSTQLFDILPDGYFDLLVTIKNNQIKNTKLTGIWSKSVPVSYTENIEVFGIRFKPLAIGNIIPFPIRELLDDTESIKLKDIGINGQIILDGLFTFPESLINQLNVHFLSILNETEVDKRLKHCFRLINASNGTASVSSISDTIGLSTRQIHRKLTSLMGLGLKDYSKIVRFKKTLGKVKYDKSDFFSYYDQSHYIREIKSFTGLTPEKLDLHNNVRFIQYYDFKKS